MRSVRRFARFLPVVCAAGLLLAACGKSSAVAGSTYEGVGGAMSVEFKSDGKATTTIGGQAADCTYTEDSKTVTLTCQGQPIVLTINGDGTLNAPPESMMGKLTKKQ